MQRLVKLREAEKIRALKTEVGSIVLLGDIRYRVVREGAKICLVRL